MSSSIEKYNELKERGKINTDIPSQRFPLFEKAEVEQILNDLRKQYEQYWKSSAPWDSSIRFEDWVEAKLTKK